MRKLWRRTRTIRPAPWPFARPRVLIEHSDRDVAMNYVPILRAAGYSVAICPGPSDARERCVLVSGERCALVDGADIVVSGLGIGADEKRAVLEALRRHHPSKPLVVEVGAQELDRFGELVDGLHLVVTPVEADELIAAVENAARVAERPLAAAG